MRRWALAVLLVALGAALLGCSSGDGSGSGDGPSAPSTTTMPGTQTLTSGGDQRSYIMVRPPGVSGPAPTVIWLHGNPSPRLGYGAQRALGLDDMAAQRGVVTVYPDGHADTHRWIVGCCSGEVGDPVDQVFLDDLIHELVSSGVTDPDHVVIGGFSAGALLTTDFACSHADEISGVVAVAGGQLRPPANVSQVVDDPVTPCAPSRPVTRLEVHGADDHALPVDGITDCDDPCGPGQGGYLPDLATADAWWRQMDQCPAGPPAAVDEGGDQVSLVRCADGAAVGLALVPGVGHDISGLVDGFDVRATLLDLATGSPLSAWPS